MYIKLIEYIGNLLILFIIKYIQKKFLISYTVCLSWISDYYLKMFL